MAITVDDILTRFGGLDAEIKLLKAPKVIMDELSAVLNRKGQVKISDFEFQFFIAKAFMSPPQFQCAVRPNAHPEFLEFSSVEYWPVFDYYTISNELVNWAQGKG